MRDSCTRLYVHLVWATWDRLPLVTPAIRVRLVAALEAKCRALRCPPLAIGCVSDHVHVLAELHPTVPVATLVKELKGSSSHLVTSAIAPGFPFKWQGSYGAFSVSTEGLPAVRDYVNGQDEHHAREAVVAAWERAEE
jgi:REP element-mobilizing transposase RayT